MQSVTGWQPHLHGSVLSNFPQHLAEHGLMDSDVSISQHTALRESARVAMLRLHYSQSIRRAELARSREPTVQRKFNPGFVFFWRAHKAVRNSRRELELRRWRGPAVGKKSSGLGFVSDCVFYLCPVGYKALTADDPMLGFLLKFAELRGWRSRLTWASTWLTLRSLVEDQNPASVRLCYLWTTFARYELPTGELQWRVLERDVQYTLEANQRRLLEVPAPCSSLVSQKPTPDDLDVQCLLAAATK